ncbi:MAG TPA: hypothetical protein VE710_21480 [Candidatus Bathyarchaeia archaeon]|nr:hypothetical protein [Candidatus Bathyarchaeia archaeon]
MNQCPLCQEQTKDKGICDTCADIIEFGYPSFPAFMLKEEKKCGRGDCQQDHTCNSHKLLSVS